MGDGRAPTPRRRRNQEGLHGLGATCLSLANGSEARCPTIFPAPPGLGATFNRTLLRAIGDAISTEARAYNNFGGNRGYQNRATDTTIWQVRNHALPTHPPARH